MKRKSKGFTLIEIVISMAISAVVLSVIVTFFITNTRTLSTTDIKSTLQQEGEVIKEALVKSGTQSNGINELSLGRGNDVLTVRQSNSTAISYGDLQVNDGTPEANSVATNEIGFIQYTDPANESAKKYISFKLVKKELSMVTVEGSNIETKVLSKNVESFRITPSDAAKILVANRSTHSFNTTESMGIDIKLIKKQGGNEVSYPISMNIVFRNRTVDFT